MRLIYLAGPYSNKSKYIMARRRKAFAEVVAHYMEYAENVCLYSPILHNAEVAHLFNLPHNFNFWAQRDFFMIKKSTALWVLTIEGWQDSYGLAQEIEYAESINREILYVRKEGEAFILTDDATIDALPLQS